MQKASGSKKKVEAEELTDTQLCNYNFTIFDENIFKTFFFLYFLLNFFVVSVCLFQWKATRMTISSP